MPADGAGPGLWAETEPREWLALKTCEVFPANTLGEYKFVVILSHMDGKYLLSRHRARTTWETQGGHIAPALFAYEEEQRA